MFMVGHHFILDVIAKFEEAAVAEVTPARRHARPSPSTLSTIPIDENSQKSELSTYLEAPPPHKQPGSYVGGFWAANKDKLPMLYRIARRLLAVPATNTSSERAFSSAGFTLSDKRNKLDPETVDSALFLKSFLSMKNHC